MHRIIHLFSVTQIGIQRKGKFTNCSPPLQVPCLIFVLCLIFAKMRQRLVNFDGESESPMEFIRASFNISLQVEPLFDKMLNERRQMNTDRYFY